MSRTDGALLMQPASAPFVNISARDICNIEEACTSIGVLFHSLSQLKLRNWSTYEWTPLADGNTVSCFEHDFDTTNFFLGKGSFGQVWKAECKTCKMVFACKNIRFPSDEEEWVRKKRSKAMKTELEVLMHIRHPHVISYVHHVITEDTMQIFTDYCDRGDLRTFMGKHKGLLSEEFTSNIFRALSSALCQCHHGLKYTPEVAAGTGYYQFEDSWTSIIHRDIKPENVFLSKSDLSSLVPDVSEIEGMNAEEHLIVKLGDFGTSCRLQDGANASTWTGTRAYWAPEIEREARIQEEGESVSLLYNKITSWSEKNDIWSVGALCYEILTGQRGPKFCNLKICALKSLDDRIDHLREEVKIRKHGVSEVLVKMIAECLDPLPERRPTALDMLAISLKEGNLVENTAMSESFWAALVRRSQPRPDGLAETTIRRFMNQYLHLLRNSISEKEACILMALHSAHIENGLLACARRLTMASLSGWAGGTIFHAAASATSKDAFLKELTWQKSKWPQNPLLAELSLKTNVEGLLPSTLAALDGDKEAAKSFLEMEEIQRKAVFCSAVTAATSTTREVQNSHSRKELEFLYLLITKDDRSWTMRTTRTAYALCLAATKGYMNIISMLIEAGVDIELRSGRGKQTALQSASASGQIDTVKLLLEKGAKIDTEDGTGKNALHCGSWCGHVEVVKLLLQNGALLNKMDQEGRTALLGAAGNGHKDVVQFLVNEGADLTVRGGASRETALERASKNGFEHIVEILSLN